MNFCHLHVHGEYSQLDGMGTAKEYARGAKRKGFKYLGLTDHGNIDGLIKFQQACTKEDITPILGCEGYMVENLANKKTDKRSHLCLFVKNQTGFKNLTNLLTIANLKGFYYRPIFDYQSLLDNLEGLVVSTGCMNSFLLNPNGTKFFKQLNKRIGEDLYLEVMPYNEKEQKKLNHLCFDLSEKYKRKMIATNDCHYIKRSDWKVQEVLLAIQRGAKWNDPKRWKFSQHGLHLRTKREMLKAFKELDRINDYSESLKNTIELAEKCSSFKIEKRKVRLPKPPIKSSSENTFLWSLVMEGYTKKIDEKDKNKEDKKYFKRAEFEFDIMKKNKLARYLLIVWELVSWCKANGIMVGPGRGSVGGSLIAYLIGITMVDSIEYGLYFERFISSDRVDLPDIDLDFEKSKRHLVRKHLEELYGEKNVASVSSFSRMKSRSIIREVGKVFDVNPGLIDSFAKQIEYNEEGALKSTIEQTDEGQQLKADYPFVVKAALRLEGQVRNYGKHAAAIVVSKNPIAESGRCNMIERNNDLLINWEKEDTEYMGLMKLDILSLNLLDIFSDTIKSIEKNHNKTIDLNQIPLDDKKVIKFIGEGSNVGIFQIGTWATTKLINDMKGVKNFEEIAAVVALVRPGPSQSGMTDNYIRRKQTGKWKPKNKIYEEITKETYGVVIYQEQVMACISRLAGLPYSTADNIRRIIGKKRDPKEFEPYKKQFIDGCRKEKTLSKNEANEFWEGLQEWAGYGFNKAHSIEYALLGYWCAWLKFYYPTEFICSNLTFGTDLKKEDLINEAYSMGLKVILPKVGFSHATDWTVNDNKLYIPFVEVKGLGPAKAKVAALTIEKTKRKIRRFYTKKKENIVEHKGQIKKILDDIGAYKEDNPAIVKDIQKYFDFPIKGAPSKTYPKLYKVFKKAAKLKEIPIVDIDSIANDSSLEEVLKGEENKLMQLKEVLILEKSFPKHEKLARCKKCKLRKECLSPVQPSYGKYNIVISGEAPGYEEDKQGEGFIGRAGKDILWPELTKYKLYRKYFHVTNAVKCFPAKTKTPTPEQINTCSRLWFKKELRKTKAKIVLAFGNTNLFLFTGKKGGIIDKSGKIEWNEKFGVFVFYCIHPAAALHNKDSKPLFKKSIKEFGIIINRLLDKGTLEEIKTYPQEGDIPF